MLRIFLLVVFFIMPSFGFACVVNPEGTHLTEQQLIDGSSSIMLAKLVRSEVAGGDHIFSFKVEETLKGKVLAEYSLSVSNELPGTRIPVGLHRNIYFWTHSYAGVRIDSDCGVRPNFLLGHSYLIFDSEKPTLKGYEEILSSDDRWYRYVKEYLSNVEPSPILSQAEVFDQFDSIHVYQCMGASLSERGYPKMVVNVKGDAPDRPFWPEDLKGCGKGVDLFLYMSSGDDYPVISLPIKEGFAYFGNMAPNLYIVDENRLDVREHISDIGKR